MTDELCNVPLKVRETTWKNLNALKKPGQTFDDVISKLYQCVKNLKKVE